jgi:hypothetical protein
VRKFAGIAIVLSGFLVTGCFDIEQTLTLERDMSGKAGFTMKVDMEPMVLFMTQMQREMEGKTGAPSAAELDKARKDFLASGKTETTGDFEKDKKDLQNKLPKGVTLEDAKFTQDGLKMVANLLFGFDKVAKLSEIELPKKDAQGGPGNPIDTPFGGLQLVDDGKTVLITSPVSNPMSDSQNGPMPPDPDMQKQMMDLFKGLRVAFRITAPFDVLEQNATRKEGNTLIWEYDFTSLSTMKAEDLAKGIRVKYRK